MVLDPLGSRSLKNSMSLSTSMQRRGCGLRAWMGGDPCARSRSSSGEGRPCSRAALCSPGCAVLAPWGPHALARIRGAKCRDVPDSEGVVCRSALRALCGTQRQSRGRVCTRGGRGYPPRRTRVPHASTRAITCVHHAQHRNARTPTHPHSHTHVLSHTHTRTHTLTLTLTLTHMHIHTHSHSHSHSTPSLQLSLSLSHTHSHTLTHTRTTRSHTEGDAQCCAGRWWRAGRR